MAKKSYLTHTASQIDKAITAVENMLETLTIQASGDAELKATGSYNYYLSYGLPASLQPDIKKVTVTLNSQNANVSNVTSEGFRINVTNVPLQTETLSLAIEVTEKHSGVTTLNYQVPIVPTPVTAITLNGNSTVGFGEYPYTITETPSDATIHVASLAVTVEEV